MLTGFLNGGTSIGTQQTGIKEAVYVSDNSTNPIMLRTVLNMRRDSLDFWNGITCFYNRWWTPNNDRLTLPFSLFHITDYSETQTVETSKKRVVMYEPPEVQEKKSLDVSLMQTIIDNTVVQPKEYKLSIVVPYMPYGRSIKEGIQITNTAMQMFQNVVGGNELSKDTVKGLEFTRMQLAQVFRQVGVVEKAFGVQQDFLESEKSSLIGINRMVNKNSLDAMVESGHIIAFKNWTGMDIRYGVITSYTASKKGGEDDVWQVQLNLKEIPVLSITPVAGKVKPVKQSWSTGLINSSGAIAGLPKLTEDIPYLNMD